MSARLRDGWIEVDCDADHMAAVAISIGPDGEPAPAFRGYGEDGKRTAKVRPPAGLHLPVMVQVTVDGHDAGSAIIR